MSKACKDLAIDGSNVHAPIVPSRLRNIYLGIARETRRNRKSGRENPRAIADL